MTAPVEGLEIQRSPDMESSISSKRQQRDVLE
jgi:hypothetical protein